MYVIELTNDSGSAIGMIPVGESLIFPADRCTWRIINGPTRNGKVDGYAISEVHFWDGTTAAGVNYTAAASTFGYVSKTGRFVPITTQFTP